MIMKFEGNIISKRYNIQPNYYRCINVLFNGNNCKLYSKAFTATGVNIELVFPKPSDTQTIPSENVDFYREKDKV